MLAAATPQPRAVPQGSRIQLRYINKHPDEEDKKEEKKEEEVELTRRRRRK